MAPIVNYGGRVLRPPHLQAALAVRILDGRHRDDVIATMRDMLGPDRAKVLGPPDLTRNVLSTAVDRIAVAFGCPPPLITGLGEELADLLGGGSASTTVERYALADGRPMPPRLAEALRIAQRYWTGACWAGLYVRWLERHACLYVEPVAPDQLDVVYTSDDPLEPTIVRRVAYRHAQSAPSVIRSVETWDEWDLTDLNRPAYRVMGGRVMDGERWTGAFAAMPAGVTVPDELVGAAYPWRYQDGRPYCPVVVVGDPSRPYTTDRLVEASLRVSCLWSHWSAGIADAGHPQRNAIGLRLAGLTTSSATGAAGIAAGPETVLQWESTDPDKQGMLHQFGPGFDPEVIGRAVRDYEASAMQTLGLPTSMEQTGGAPSDLEEKRMEKAIAREYPRCRQAVLEVLRRAAAIATAQGDRVITEDGYGALFGDEIEDALAAAGAVDTDEEGTNGSGPTGAADDPGDRGGGSPPAEEPPEAR